MKKAIRFAVAMILVLLAVCIGAACAEEQQLPADISAYFSAESFAGAEITDSASWEDTGRGSGWFVLIRTARGENVLYCFKPKDGGWVKNFSTSSAVPQGQNITEIFTTPSIDEYMAQQHTEGQFLVIHQVDGIFTAYKLASSGRWNLVRYINPATNTEAVVSEGAITYYWDADLKAEEGTARGTIMRDLRYVSLGAFPKTYKDAEKGLTEPPTLPEGSELVAQEIEFTGGQQYPVYSAPDENSLRGNNGKALVSTNGWIQVFGEENGWILIQYSIDKTHYRFGYIDAASLPKKAEVSDLSFTGVAAVISGAVTVTDDPLFSKSELATLSGGETVTWLATMGDWAYIEAEGFRGFVPAGALSFSQMIQESFEFFISNDGEQYNLFEIRKLHFGQDHQVSAVSGVYEMIVSDGDGDHGQTALDGEFTYNLAPDFHADMMAPGADDPSALVPVTDLYAWYIAAYRNGEEPESGDLVFLYDLPEDQRETAAVDFWFVTTRIRLNENNEIEYMEYCYVPWG